MAGSLKNAAGELHLQFQIGDDRYALPACEVVEVLPLRKLKQLPEAPAWVAGLFSHRGRMVPVLDLCQRVLGRAARARSSTRLVLVRYRGAPDAPVLGLVLEQATDTLRLASEAFADSGLEAGLPQYLGPVQPSSAGVVQRINIDGLLDERMRALLFQPVTQD